MRVLLVLFFCFLYVLAKAQPANDNFASAIDVAPLINGCSSDAFYTTFAATSDKNAGTCWNTGASPFANVWFKFLAPASGQINVTVDIGGSKGTQQRTQLALWQSDGTTQVSCNRYVNNGDDVSLGATGLIPGNLYYISTDVQSAGYRGTFTLCLSSTVDYDYYEGAADLTATIGSCSADAAYTTIGGTPDKNAGTCWNTGATPLYNRWFKFTAPGTGMINVTVDIGGSKGTQQRTQLALWQANGTTQITCNRYINNGDDVSLGATGLTPGATYYISVDAQSAGYYGSFTMCLSSAVDYDYYEGAIDVTASIGSCSVDAAYSTTGGTPDKNTGTCWNTGATPLYNRWFKFTAPGSGMINATVDIGGSKGTQQRTQLALWQANGITQVTCNRYINNGDDVSLGATGLTPGATYYISVDAQSAGYYGTFTLCLSSVVDYDYYEGAIDVTATIGSCSADAAYSTIGGTSDKNTGTCWNTGATPLYNRWFKFTAPGTGMINVTVDIGGSKGTQQRTQLALWQSDGVTPVTCNRYVTNADDVVLGSAGLTPGATYYISVDAQSAGYYGTFTLCLSNALDYDYYEGAIDVTASIDGCSADAAYSTLGGTADKNVGSCWNTGATPLFNRWFKFIAPGSGMINVTVDIGGTKGTQQRTQLALWQSDGITPVTCNRYVNNGDDVVLGSTTLTPGATYYISVDAQSGGYYGSFTLCLSSAVDYDYYEGAIDVTASIGSCSPDAAYSTIGGTTDKNVGNCWNTGATPLYNRWFKFTAPGTGMINVTVDIGGTKGTQQRTQLALWQANGTTQVSCNRYINNGDDVVLGSTTLTPGATYYISVDAQSAGYYGSFTLCLTSTVDYDYYEGAIDVTASIGSCSADAAYTTIGGTTDKNVGSCWNTGATPLYNRWFKFTAPGTGMINVTVDIGGSKGTQQRTQLALWQSDGTTPVACNRYINNGDDVVLGSTTLTPGAIYYISVDAQSAGYYGSFTLCLTSAVDYDYYEGAIDVTATIGSCSADAAYTTIGATADKNIGSCWNTGATPLYNRWFKFTAPATGMINVTVDIGGSKGTQQRTQLALWQSDGITPVTCNRYVNNGDDVVMGSTTLTPGATYYISVDAQSAGYYGSFTLCLSGSVDYDYYAGAIVLWDLNNFCSADAAYTTIGATPDKNAGTCWNTGATPLYNRWFKFVASATGMINITVDIGGSKGTQQRTQLALWQMDGVTQVSCNRYVNNGDDVILGANGLSPGGTYYISVDAQSAGYYGTFSLCITDAVDYDYYQGAIELTDLNNWCSADAAYSTIGATPDKNKGTCWNTGATPLYNRWFKFQAITVNATIIVDIGGSKGTQQRTQVALWQADGTTQVACNRYVANGDDVSIATGALVVGNWYYISVDAQSAGYYGSFTLCVNNVGTTYYSRLIGPWNNANTWSTAGYGGAVAASFPNAGDIAKIRGYDITVSTNQAAAEVDLDVATANTSLVVDNSALTVNGKIVMTNTGNNFTGALTIQNNGSLFVNDILTVSRSGGNQSFGVNVNNGCSLTVNKDVNWSSTAGTVFNNLLTVNGSGQVTVNRDVNLISTGGQLIKLQFNNTSIFTVARDITYSATAAGQELIELNNTGRLRIGRNFVRGGTPFGSLTSNGSSTVEFNGSVSLQTFPANAGSGGDSFTFLNVVINNTRITKPQITMAGAVTINGNLTMTNGVVNSTVANIINLKNATVTTIGNSGSYIDGPMTYEVATNTANTIRNLPLGKGIDYRPAVLTLTHSDNTSVIYTAEHFNTSAAALGYSLPATLDKVSAVRYWIISRTAVANLTTAKVTLYYGIGTGDGVTDFANLRVAKTVGAGVAWVDAGGVGTANGAGSITSAGFNTFCTMTIANEVGGTNTLPITLKRFNARPVDDKVNLTWTTASEINNDYFEVERSKDGFEFETVVRVDGAGTKVTESSYSIFDEHPLRGISYYRLRQTDYDNHFTFSNVVVVDLNAAGNTKVVIYPNPSDGADLNVQLSGFDENEIVGLSLMDFFGRSIMSSNVNTDRDGSGAVALKTTRNLAGGIYFVLVTSRKGMIHTKVIVR